MQKNWTLLSDRRPGTVEEILQILLGNRGMQPGHLHRSLGDLAGYVEMKGIDDAARLMAEHIRHRSKIVLVSDYDCDGVTSAAQASMFLEDIGYTEFDVFIPLRADGYGMPIQAVEDHPDASLFVCLDCGTRDTDSIAHARSRGADCIVIDHHEVPEGGTSPASVLVNPKQEGCPAPFKEFCAAGLTLLFLTRLRRYLPASLARPKLGGKYLELAALGTVADLVPLLEGNRILTQHGLKSINSGASLPLRQLINVAGLSKKPITSGHLGYQLGPRINVAGRLGDARRAYELLMSRHPDSSHDLANELDHLNRQRQEIEKTIMAHIRQRIAANPRTGRTLVLADTAWPLGLVGIVASRVQHELRYGPVVILSIDRETGIARGSARSVPGLDIHQILSECDDVLLRWGGHRMAAGLSLDLQSIEVFSGRLEMIASSYPDGLFRPNGNVDVCLETGCITRELVDAMKTLEPHGSGNMPPTFAFRNVDTQIVERFGRERTHLRMRLENHLQGILWRGAERPDLSEWENGGPQDVVCQITWDEYRNIPSCDIKDIGRLSPPQIARQQASLQPVVR
jgi:single-stranded-DNA-specific exonuclease